MAFPADNRRVNLSGTFGPRKPIKLTNGGYSGSFHYAVDLAPETPGYAEPVYAVGAGTIHSVGKKSDAGIFVILRTGGRLWRYCHLSSLAVRAGDRVADGAMLGRMGATGNVTGVHLHLECYPGEQLSSRIDPLPLIWHEWNPALGKGSAPVNPPVITPTPAPPAKTAEQIEEEELMSAASTIIDAVKAHVTAEVKTLTSRMRREARPILRYVSVGADGKQYTRDTSPLAALVHPSGGFIYPLLEPNRAGQIASLKANYRLMAFDDEGEGAPEATYLKELGTILVGTGRLPIDSDEAERIEGARALFDHVAGRDR